MTTGIGAPFSSCAVRALKALQNSMMFKPRWPSAGPIGGDGLAAPAGTCSLIKPVIFLAMRLLRAQARPSGRPEDHARVRFGVRTFSPAGDRAFSRVFGEG